MRKLSVLLVLGLLLVGFPASAAEAYLDGDDTSGRLDIARLEQHVVTDTGARRLVHVISMYESWPTRLFRVARHRDGSGATRRATLSLFFDTRGDRRREYSLYAYHSAGKWESAVCNSVRRGEKTGDLYPICEPARVSRPDGRSIAISVRSKDLLPRRDRDYGWRAKTELTFAGGCPDGGGRTCRDWAPGRPQYLRHSF